MFVQPVNSATAWRRALVFSLVLHVGLLTWLCWRPEPPLVTASAVMEGNSGSSIGIVYLPTDPSLHLAVNEQAHALRYARPVKKKRALRKAHSVAPVREDDHATDAKLQSPASGSSFGSFDFGPSEGHDVRPALPVNFPDPHVNASELPAGLTGDVVVEVTIDSYGNIVKRRVLQSLGTGIDDKVLAVLENWRFRPATRDGIPIPSRQDVHFHFPS
ncbi:MAG TPA: TonB family protein [Terriglobales bacterium]|nr:TonB family protein [Terriglobales bacterium]